MRKKKQINIEVGERIKWYREKAGLTQERFSEILDLSTNHISDIERGISGVSLEALKRMCEVLCVSADRILMGEGCENENDVTHMTDKLKKLEPIFYEKLEAIINYYIEAVTMPRKK